MRKKFKQQLGFGQVPINEVEITTKSRDAFPKLLRALQELYKNSKYMDAVFRLLSSKIILGKKITGREGMELWSIFVLAETRLCLNISYDRLHDLVNNHSTLRQMIGIDTSFGCKKLEIRYQNIIDNVSLLDDSLLQEINELIVQMGHDVFKKKDSAALHLKTDSFVVETNVHYPTDYNLLYDGARKSLDIIDLITKKYPDIKGWRSICSWKKKLKNGMYNLSQVSRSGGTNKKERLRQSAEHYLNQARLLDKKITKEKQNLPSIDLEDLGLLLSLDYFQEKLQKHINLLYRRIIKGEQIPHKEKEFSLFEPHTEWITKGKQHPSVELGKNLLITTDQYNLILDYYIMDHETDKSTVLPLADRMLGKHIIYSWSFDRGFYTKSIKELLSLYIPQLVMPKKGKKNTQEKLEEGEKNFKKRKNKHSAIESNINELENRGLDRCPDKGYNNFKRYIALLVGAYNLHKIGAELLKQDRQKDKNRLKKAA